MSKNFTCSIQLASHNFDQYGEKGSVDFEKVIQEFTSFLWIQQLSMANVWSKPKIIVKNLDNGTECLVSIMEEPNKYNYLLGIVYRKEKSTFCGFGKSKIVRWLEIYVVEERESMERIFGMFFTKDIELILAQLKDLPKLNEMEAINYR